MNGVALVIVLVLVAAGMALSSAVATSAALELGMAEQSTTRLRAYTAAEAGLASALRARAWSAGETWTESGALPDGGTWRVEVRLAAVRLDPVDGTPDWHFEVESTGRDGTAIVTLLQGFRVAGPLPGEPQHTWWRHAETTS